MGFAFTDIFRQRGGLSHDITSIDVLKTVAVGLMLVDHIGFYLFPQFEWFRVFGRLCVPIWFFLIGYADTRTVPGRWYAAVAVLAVSNFMIGVSFWHLCVIATMIFSRLYMDVVWRFVSARRLYFWWFVLLFAFFGYVTDMVMEYGTIGFLLASVGYVVKNRGSVRESMGDDVAKTFPIIAFVVFGVMSWLVFGFSVLAGLVMALGLCGVYLYLMDFKPQVYAGLTDSSYSTLLRVCGRYSLEIYVAHVLFLRGMVALKNLAFGLF